jgi:hypothetical protein
MKRVKNPYRHERIVSPRTLAKRGLTKYRSIVTPGGDVLRLAFPPSRKRRGAGELQAILYKKNPPQIYGWVTRIEAVKGPGHKCDAECRRHGHRYYHDFSRKNRVELWANSDTNSKKDNMAILVSR